MSSSSSHTDKTFGWWLYADREIEMSPIASDRHLDDRNGRGFPSRERREHASEIAEKIQLTSFTEEDDRLDPMEKDASEENESSASDSEGDDGEESKLRAVCYTPERLIKSQMYRILVPPPRYQVSPRLSFAAEEKSYRQRLSCLIDPEKIDSARSDQRPSASTTDKKEPTIFEHDRCTLKIQPVEDSPNTYRTVQNIETINSNGRCCCCCCCCCSRLNDDPLYRTCNDCKEPIVPSILLQDTRKEDTRKRDSNVETPCDPTAQSTPMSLCEELGIISRRHSHFISLRNNRGTAINEVMSILEGLPSDAEKATILLEEEEDRFCDSMSSHDQLTRLALTIETDVEETLLVADDTDNWIERLRDKMERLQLANKEIYQDTCALRTNFESDEKKIKNLASDTTKMLEELHELRYFDDLLKLLEGELEQISKRNWPFILGHNNPHEEMNLII